MNAAAGPAGPSIAVLLCVHQDNPWLDQAVRSVLDQADPDFEFLVAANGCTDALWSRLQGLLGGDPRARLFRSGIAQLAFNLNLLADNTRADYLLRMDADDVSEPQRVGRFRAALRDGGYDVLGSAVRLIDGEGRDLGGRTYPATGDAIRRALPVRTVFCHPSVAIRREFLLQVRGYLGGFASEDFDLWLRAQRAGARMGNLPDALLQYRVHGAQVTASRRGYAEVAGYWLRELLLHPGLLPARGLAMALGKWAAGGWLARRRRQPPA